MTQETEIAIATQKAEEAGYSGAYKGMIIHLLEEKLHLLHQLQRPLSDQERKDCAKALKDTRHQYAESLKHH